MFTSKMVKSFSFLVGVLLLVGCQRIPLLSLHPVEPVAAEPDVVSLRLSQAAERAAAALETISEIEQYRAPPMPTSGPDYADVPGALQSLMTVKWTGPVEQILETLATRVNMKFVMKGNRSAVPLVVNINVYQKPVIEVLRDLGLQLGRRADVTVNGERGLIELRYAAVDRT
jgi:defect-in-organelle-trafficking protein DotD